MNRFFEVSEREREAFRAEVEASGKALGEWILSRPLPRFQHALFFSTLFLRKAAYLVADNSTDDQDQAARKAEAVDIFGQWLDAAFTRRNRIRQKLGQKDKS